MKAFLPVEMCIDDTDPRCKGWVTVDEWDGGSRQVMYGHWWLLQDHEWVCQDCGKRKPAKDRA